MWLGAEQHQDHDIRINSMKASVDGRWLNKVLDVGLRAILARW
jgi:hypothetical protein